jgi:hypothetical protein
MTAMLMDVMNPIVPSVTFRILGKSRRYNKQIDALIRPVIRVYMICVTYRICIATSISKRFHTALDVVDTVPLQLGPCQSDRHPIYASLFHT